MSNRKKRELLKKIRRAKITREQKKRQKLARKNGTIIQANKAKVISRSVLPKIPDYYEDTWFTCKDCGKADLWTAKMQKRWHEEQGGEIEAIAVRCNPCRQKEKLRKENARKTHLEGLNKR